jgi:O-acetylhomoserine (thiol)-lyase
MNLGFSTRAIHGTGSGKEANRALQFPIYAGVAHDFESAEAMGEAFSGRRAAFAYSRIANPTVDAFEKKLTLLENGLASVAVSSGMAAISTTLLNLISQGDNIVSSSSLFGGTFSLFRNVFSPLGIEVRFVPINDLKAMEAAIDGNTRAIFLETISNPCTVVPDFEGIARIAHTHKLVLIADSTATTPYLFPAKHHGINIVIHSTTKYISGGATSMGGAIVDLGTFDWSAVPALKGYHRLRNMAFIARLRKEVYRETGSCMSPHDAYLQSLGLETLALRMERVCQNAQAVAEFLSQQKSVRSVDYPGLTLSPYHGLAKQQFKGRYGGILAFSLPDKTSCFRFLNRLTLIRRSSNLGDNKSLVLHPATTIYAGFTADELKSVGVDDTIIRLSVGIEDADDIIADFRQALAGI